MSSGPGSHRSPASRAAGVPRGPRLKGRPPTAAQVDLLRQARSVALNAYAPYSGLRVGAVVVDSSGGRHLGVNVENASYRVGQCAARVARGALVTAGQTRVDTVAVAAADGRDLLPCGACLQALAELGSPEVVVQVAGSARVFCLEELLASPFALAESRAGGKPGSSGNTGPCHG